MIDVDMTVNELIARHPATVATFNAFGIDACCGGAVPVREAALRDGADPAALLTALELVVETAASGTAGSRATGARATGARA